VTAYSREEQLHALTDPALTRLELDDLLVEMLDRVRDILEADTAAILLLDENLGQLVARAARGIEEELYQNVRISIREGFAGLIAAERHPVILDRVGPTTVANPILWQKGLRTMLGVPLLSGDSVLGVLHVGRLTERPFTQEDVELLEVAAERITLTTQARLLETELATARLLERSLVPGVLHRLPGFELATRYVTALGARGAGGDWYDAFRLPSGELWITVGDVAGHGLSAAVVMAQLRATIRAYAYDGAPPHEVLRSTDRTLQYFEPDVMATVVCVSIVPTSHDIRICSAGHPPPVAAAPGAVAQPLPIEQGPPLGAVPNVPRVTTALPFPPGAALALYTDGLIERRGEDFEVGLQKLSQAVTPDAPELVCRQIMLQLIGDTPPEDDVALIVLRRSTTRS